MLGISPLDLDAGVLKYGKIETWSSPVASVAC